MIDINWKKYDRIFKELASTLETVAQKSNQGELENKEEDYEEKIENKVTDLEDYYKKNLDKFYPGPEGEMSIDKLQGEEVSFVSILLATINTTEDRIANKVEDTLFKKDDLVPYEKANSYQSYRYIVLNEDYEEAAETKKKIDEMWQK